MDSETNKKSDALKIIRQICEYISGIDEKPLLVSKAISDIISISKYEHNTLPASRLREYGIGVGEEDI